MPKKITIGRIAFQVKQPTHATQSLQQYGQRVLGGIPAVLVRSETRVFEAVRAATPVKTGHMQANLLRTSDIAPVEDSYQVFWRKQEFLGEVNPAGKIIQNFYPATLILGGPKTAARYPALMTEQLEAERPLLVKDLSEHFAKAAK